MELWNFGHPSPWQLFDWSDSFHPCSVCIPLHSIRSTPYLSTFLNPPIPFFLCLEFAHPPSSLPFHSRQECSMDLWNRIGLIHSFIISFSFTSLAHFFVSFPHSLLLLLFPTISHLIFLSLSLNLSIPLSNSASSARVPLISPSLSSLSPPSSSNFSASPAFLVLFFSHGSHPVGSVPSHAPCAFSFSLPLLPLQSPSISSILSFLASLLSGDYLTFRHSCVSVWERPLSISLPLPVRLASHSSIPFPLSPTHSDSLPPRALPILYVISIFIHISFCLMIIKSSSTAFSPQLGSYHTCQFLPLSLWLSAFYDLSPSLIMYMTASINNCLTAISSFVLSLIALCFLPSAYYLYIPPSLLSVTCCSFSHFSLPVFPASSCWPYFLSVFSHAVMQSYTDRQSFTIHSPIISLPVIQFQFHFIWILLFRFAALISTLPLPNSFISALTTTGAVNRLVLFIFCREESGFDVAHFADWARDRSIEEESIIRPIATAFCWQNCIICLENSAFRRSTKMAISGFSNNLTAPVRPGSTTYLCLCFRKLVDFLAPSIYVYINDHFFCLLHCHHA